MSIITKPVMALALASLVGAQSTSSVITIFFPDGNGQQLVGSIIEADASQTTLAVSCAPSVTDLASCGVEDVITVTVGPSTFHAQDSFDGITAVLDCELDGTTAATCAQTYVGPESLLEEETDNVTATDATITNTAFTTIETSTTLEQSAIAFVPVTLVDALEGAAATGASGSASTAANTGSSTRTGSSTATQTGGSSSASGATTPSGNSDNGASRVDLRTLALTAAGAGLMGLTAFLL